MCPDITSADKTILGTDKRCLAQAKFESCLPEGQAVYQGYLSPAYTVMSPLWRGE